MSSQYAVSYLGVEDHRVRLMDANMIDRLIKLSGHVKASVRLKAVDAIIALVAFGKQFCPCNI